MIFRTSSSKPRSIMRSASSMQRYLQLLRVKRFFSSISMSLPGVATTICRPLFMTWLCSPIEIPPIQRRVFNWWYFPSLESAVVQVSIFSYVWLANSREGQSITPTGPSPRINGSFVSSSRAIIISGKQKASVFPEPVKAIPIISRPENLCMTFSKALKAGKRRSIRDRDTLQLNGCRGDYSTCLQKV